MTTVCAMKRICFYFYVTSYMLEIFNDYHGPVTFHKKNTLRPTSRFFKQSLRAKTSLYYCCRLRDTSDPHWSLIGLMFSASKPWYLSYIVRITACHTPTISLWAWFNIVPWEKTNTMQTEKKISTRTSLNTFCQQVTCRRMLT
jgi:hypothetical protein